MKTKEFNIIDKDVKKIDSRSRITIPSKILKYWDKLGGCDAVQIAMNEKGEVLLKPTISVPLDEVWLYNNPDSLKKVRDGLDDVQEDRVNKVRDLDEFIDSL
ncbi:MAG: hypothetical protein SVK54_05510 [candidate division WOR-3 bacterium]|nr:hypothetical protein [candidate division WOR-3 bacterium]